MVKVKFLTFTLAFCLLAACASSAQSIQTAIAKTQVVLGQTQAVIPTVASTATPTSAPTITFSTTKRLSPLQRQPHSFPSDLVAY